MVVSKCKPAALYQGKNVIHDVLVFRFTLGVGFRVQYGDLLKGFDDLPVFRTTSEDRMVDSA
jgi:hypothetical protein